MSHSLVASTALARRIALAQLAAGAGVGMVTWWLSAAAVATAVVVGAAAIALATFVMAQIALGGGVQSGEAVMLRWLVGMVAKWVIVAIILLLAIGLWKLSPMPVLAGVAVALIASTIAALKRT